MNKTILFGSLFLCFGAMMAQNQQHPTVEEMMRQHRAEELKRYGINEVMPASASEHKPTVGIKAQSMAAAQQLCDSIVRYTPDGMPEYLQVFTYNTDGNRTRVVDYYWQDGQWCFSYKSEISYDANGFISQEIGYSYWSEMEEWLASSRYDYLYDDRGNHLCTTGYYWDGQDWVGRYRDEYTYDDNNFQTSYSGYNWSNDEWQGTNKYEYSFDNQGRQTSFASYRWYEGAWVGNWKSEYDFDSYGHQTSYTSYNWYDGAWVGADRSEFYYDAEGHEIGVASFFWLEGEWIQTSRQKTEHTFDGNGYPTLSISYSLREGDEWVANIKREYTYDDQGNMLSEIFSFWYEWEEAWSLSDKHEYAYDAQGNQVSDYYYTWIGYDWALQQTNELTYDAHGNMTDNAMYSWRDGIPTGMQRFGYTFDDNDNRISYTQYTWRDGEWVVAYFSECTIDANGRQTGLAYYSEQDVYSGPVTLTVNLANDPLGDYIDDQDLLFTGGGYKLNALYVDEYVGELENPGLKNSPIWTNDGSHGVISWSGEYRFSNEWNSTGDEIYAFSMEDWDKLKTGTFYVDLAVAGDYPQIRVTSGWWSTVWTGDDIFLGNELLKDNGDGTWTLAVNLEGDPLLDVMDSQHLLFTGNGYTVLKIRTSETREEDWVRRCIWQNNNADDYINWSGTYRFGKEGHEGECIATFNDADWNLIHNGYLTADIENAIPDELHIYVTSGWWTTLYTGDAIRFGNPLLSGNLVPVMKGDSKYEETFDDEGNRTSYTSYRWSWELQDWQLSYTEIYYYSTNDVTDIDEVLTSVRSRLSKEMRDGKVFIVVGDKTYTLDGQEVTK